MIKRGDRGESGTQQLQPIRLPRLKLHADLQQTVINIEGFAQQRRR
jgi:hypothetical protein